MCLTLAYASEQLCSCRVFVRMWKMEFWPILLQSWIWFGLQTARIDCLPQVIPKQNQMIMSFFRIFQYTQLNEGLKCTYMYHWLSFAGILRYVVYMQPFHIPKGCVISHCLHPSSFTYNTPASMSDCKCFHSSLLVEWMRCFIGLTYSTHDMVQGGQSSFTTTLNPLLFLGNGSGVEG